MVNTPLLTSKLNGRMDHGERQGNNSPNWWWNCRELSVPESLMALIGPT